MSIYDVHGNQISVCYKVDGTEVTVAYDADGNPINTSGVDTDYSQPTVTSFKTISTLNTQGMDIYNNVLFQFRGNASSTPNDLVCLYNWKTGESIAPNMYIDSGHGNAVAFSKTFYQAGDSYPLIYCGDWFNPIVHVNRVTIYGATNLYNIVYDVATAGYYSNPCIDFADNTMYTVGYKQQSTSSSASNYCIVCKWDLSEMTDNGDDTFTPTLIWTENISFISVMQDLKFNDGYIWITSGKSGNTQYLRALNPTNLIFDYTITMPITTEIEGLVWQIDPQTGLYFAYVGFQGGIYYKITFVSA